MKHGRVILLALATMWCVPKSPDWYEHQDWSIEFPSYWGDQAKPDVTLDGPTFRALQVAVADFMPPTHQRRACMFTPAGHTYKILRQGDIIFIEMEIDMKACGSNSVALESEARYAISATDGRILRRLLPFEYDRVEQPDGSSYQMDHKPIVLPDGGMTTQFQIGLEAFAAEARAMMAPPDADLSDAGTPDAGTPDADIPDAGSSDAGTPDGGSP